MLDTQGLHLRQDWQFLTLTVILSKIFFEGINKNKEDCYECRYHKLSNNVYLENIRSVVHQTAISQKYVTVLTYTLLSNKG